MTKVGNMPQNMSVLLMSNNKLTKLSKEIISFVSKLKDFNVENNLFNNFPPELAKIVTKGSTISFKGRYTVLSYNINYNLSNNYHMPTRYNN